MALADRGRRVLLVSTDPASNLDEVLETALGPTPVAIAGVPGLFALNLDPEQAARAYREKMVGPFRGVLPDAALRSIEEQLSGACTVEIAAFDEFSKLLGDARATEGFDHVVFDTAPTGHTLRLLELPAAWTGFLEANVGGNSCLGPLAGLKVQQALYAASRAALVDGEQTALVLVSRAESSALAEAERTRRELAALGVARQELVLNGLFTATDRGDAVACAIEARGAQALAGIPGGLAALPRTEVGLVPFGLVGLVGVEALRVLLGERRAAVGPAVEASAAPALASLGDLVGELATAPTGVILTMGKGGVGKTTIAVSVAVAFARRGARVHLTTTDPAAHVEAALGAPVPGLRVTRIDPEAETAAYRDEVLRTTGASLDAAGRALREEDLRSPCTEEVAVFRAFAKVVDQGERELVVIDTAPTGHTLLLLDAAESYHREVLRTRRPAPQGAPDEVRKLLPRLRDPAFTRVLLVTLAEATPVHEAAALQRDLARAEIHPFAWVVNQSLTPLTLRDPILRQRRLAEGRYLAEVVGLARRTALVPWTEAGAGRLELFGASGLA
ncbi:MAG: arsenical pump-driving ATPase [Deltaproteobacteria bacterium]|nr:arsenical pump-driving ATPase [Deltaproteobacteria bacterium]